MEKMDDLRANVLYGLVGERGTAWHDNNSAVSIANRFDAGIPVEVVKDRLFPWDAIKADVQVPFVTADGVTTITSTDHQAVIRSDTGAILGIHAPGYAIHQYSDWLIGNVSNILDDDELVIGSAVLLQGGAVAAVQVTTPDTLDIGGDEFRPFFLATTSHNGRYASSYRFCFTRLACDNTLRAAHQEEGPTARVRHTKNSALQIANVRQALGIVHKETEAFKAEVDELMNWAVTDAQFEEFMAKEFPVPNEAGRGQTVALKKTDAINDLYFTDSRVGFNGTAWGVKQAVSTYDQQMTRVNKGGNKAEKNILEAAKGTLWTGEDRALMTLREVCKV